jgi:hypothetical protein
MTLLSYIESVRINSDSSMFAYPTHKGPVDDDDDDDHVTGVKGNTQQTVDSSNTLLNTMHPEPTHMS